MVDKLSQLLRLNKIDCEFLEKSNNLSGNKTSSDVSFVFSSSCISEVDNLHNKVTLMNQTSHAYNGR